MLFSQLEGSGTAPGEMDVNITVRCNVTTDTNSSCIADVYSGRLEIPTWGFWVNFICTPFIVLVGCFGNVMSFVVMKSQALRQKSYSNYLCALAVFDTMTLISRLLLNVDSYYLDFQRTPGLFQNFSEVSCKIYNFLEHVAYLMSSWLVVFMAIERLCAVKFPFKKVFIRQHRGSLVAIGCLLLLVCVSQSFRLVMIEHAQLRPEVYTCLAALHYGVLFTSLDVYFYQASLTFILPVLIVFITNTLVLCQIFKVRRDVRDGDRNMTPYSRGVGKKHRTTCMLMIVSFTYIVTLLPVCSLSIFMDAWIKLSPLSNMSERAHAWSVFTSLKPVLDVSQTISLINYAVNFFIYVLSGRSFRFELRKVCRRKKPQAKRGLTVRYTREEFIRL